MKKKFFNFEKRDLQVKVINRSMYKRYENPSKLISYIKLDHMFY